MLGVERRGDWGYLFSELKGDLRSVKKESTGFVDPKVLNPLKGLKLKLRRSLSEVGIPRETKGVEVTESIYL